MVNRCHRHLRRPTAAPPFVDVVLGLCRHQPTFIVSENPPQAAHRHDCSLSSLHLLPLSLSFSPHAWGGFKF